MTVAENYVATNSELDPNESEGEVKVVRLQTHDAYVTDSTTVGHGAADSACNRTVSGGRWMDKFIAEINRMSYQYHVETIHEYFRFGGGERLVAKERYTTPIGLFGMNALLRVCVVREGKGNDL